MVVLAAPLACGADDSDAGSSDGSTGGSGSTDAAGVTDSEATPQADSTGADGDTDTADGESSSDGAPICGDSVVSEDEACDDGRESAACNDDCTLAACGDSIINAAAGETCDDGKESARCDIDCTEPVCGDAVTNVLVGEECDAGQSSAVCNADCLFKGWEDGSLIEDDGPDVGPPLVAMNASGEATAAWVQFDDPQWGIHASHYNPRSGTWSDDEIVESNIFVSAMMSDLAINDDGVAVAIWVTTFSDSILARVYDPGSQTWGPDLELELGNPVAASASVAINSEGDAAAAWRQEFEGVFSIYGNRYSAATSSWGDPVLLETSFVPAAAPSVAMSDEGDVTVVWRQSSQRANHFDADSGEWGTAVNIAPSGSGDSPDIAMSHGGDAIAVWSQDDDGLNNLYASHYDAAGSTWAEPLLIETDDTGDAHSPQIGADAAGNAFVAWQQSDGEYSTNRASRYEARTDAWSEALVFESKDKWDSGAPRLAVSSTGNAVVAWSQWDGSENGIQARHYDVLTDMWGDIVPAESAPGSASGPDVGIDDVGNCIAVWASDPDAQTPGNDDDAFASVFH